MCLLRLGVCHLLRVAVIGSDQHLATDVEDRVADPPEAFVQHLDRLYRRIEEAGVPDHVAVGIVADDEIETIAADRLDQPVRHLVSAHLRLQVVGRHLRRRHQDALFALVRGLDTAVEEEGDVCVLLGLRDPQLVQTQVGDVFAEGILQSLRRIGDGNIEILAVLGQTRR